MWIWAPARSHRSSAVLVELSAGLWLLPKVADLRLPCVSVHCAEECKPLLGPAISSICNGGDSGIQCPLLHKAQYINTALDFCWFPKIFCFFPTLVYVWLSCNCGVYPISKIIADSWHFSLYQNACSQLFNNGLSMVVHSLFLVTRDWHYQVFKAFYINILCCWNFPLNCSWTHNRFCSCDFSGSMRVSGCYHSREKEALGSGTVPSSVINSQADLMPFIMLRKGFSCSLQNTDIY